MYSSAGIPQRALKALENLLRVSKRLAMATLLGMGVWGEVGMLATQFICVLHLMHTPSFLSFLGTTTQNRLVASNKVVSH